MKRYTEEELDEMDFEEIREAAEECVEGFTKAEDNAFRKIVDANEATNWKYKRKFFTEKTAEELSKFFGVPVTERVRYALIVSWAYEERWDDFDDALNNNEDEIWDAEE